MTHSPDSDQVNGELKKKKMELNMVLLLDLSF